VFLSKQEEGGNKIRKVGNQGKDKKKVTSGGVWGKKPIHWGRDELSWRKVKIRRGRKQ